jgi:V/A-type H+-transporting ATPase subunit K
MIGADVGLMAWLGIGGVFGRSCFGAAIGMAANGPAVIGAWKKCYLQNRPAPFIILVFAGTTLTNIIYGFILLTVLSATTVLGAHQIMVLGIGAGLCIGGVAITQAMCSAAGAEAFVETGKGFGNYLMVVGIAETVSLFSVVFTIILA